MIYGSEPKKVQLIVEDLDKFSYDIYNMYPMIDTQDMANKIIGDLKDNLTKLYDMIDKKHDFEEVLSEYDIDLYKIGDVINLLNLIEVKADDVKDEPIITFE